MAMRAPAALMLLIQQVARAFALTSAAARGSEAAGDEVEGIVAVQPALYAGARGSGTRPRSSDAVTPPERAAGAARP